MVLEKANRVQLSALSKHFLLCHSTTKSIYLMYSWGIKGFNTPYSVWNKTTLITSSVDGTGVNPPSCKMSTFFLRSLALSVPIYRNLQSNGGKWPLGDLLFLRMYQTWNHQTKITTTLIPYYIIFFFKV